MGIWDMGMSKTIYKLTILKGNFLRKIGDNHDNLGKTPTKMMC